MAYPKNKKPNRGYIGFDPTDYTVQYHKDHLVRVPFNLSHVHEQPLIDWLYAHPNKQGYLKDLIKADMLAHGAAVDAVEPETIDEP